MSHVEVNFLTYLKHQSEDVQTQIPKDIKIFSEMAQVIRYNDPASI